MATTTTTTTAGFVREVIPPVLDAASDPPSLFDGTTRLYVSLTCPFAQRTWIVRNYKGLQEKIKLVPINLQNRPAWYKEKVYSGNKVPSLEHNNEVKGESLDLIKYINEHFEGPALLPDDPAKQQFSEELFSYSDTFNNVNYAVLMSKGDVSDEVGAAYDKLEHALSKFDDGPFFLGQFSLVMNSCSSKASNRSVSVRLFHMLQRVADWFSFLFVDIAYAPFIERFHVLFLDVYKYDITKGRPKLEKWIEELNKIDAYTSTRRDPQELLAYTKKRFGVARI